MSNFQRSIVFTAPQWKWLQARAKELGISIAEAIRRIVDEKREDTK